MAFIALDERRPTSRVRRQWIPPLAIGFVAIAAFVAAPRVAAQSNAAVAVTTAPDTSAAPVATAEFRALEERVRTQQDALERLEKIVADQSVLLRQQQTVIDRLQGGDRPADAQAKPAQKEKTTQAAAGADDSESSAGASGETTSGDSPGSKGYLDRWARIKPSGEIRIRSDSEWNRGMDEPEGELWRTRLRLRLRFGLAGQINDSCDWALRLASGAVRVNDTQNVTFDHGFTRKSIGIDRAYIHYDTDRGFDEDDRRVKFEATAGKMPIPWEVTEIAFDDVLQPEGLSESVKVKVSDAKLTTLGVTTWQLSFNERDAQLDAYIYGVQANPHFEWSDNWSTNLWGQYFRFQHFSAGALGTDLGVPTSPKPLFDSSLVAAIAETDYEGWGEKAGDDSKWGLGLRFEWIHNLSGISSEKNGFAYDVELGRDKKQGDWLFEGLYYRADADVLPLFFLSTDDIGTNAQSTQISASYLVEKRIKLRARYIGGQTLETSSLVNRWLNRAQFDVTYGF